jgi:MarR family transcriptional regulator for hemolysin
MKGAFPLMQENTPFGVSELLVQAQRMKKWYEEALHAVAVQYGLTMNELSVLLFLANNPALNTARDIVQLRALAKSHVCMSVDRWRGAAFLRSRPMKKDKRRVRLFVTKAGQPAARAGQAAQQAFIRPAARGRNRRRIRGAAHGAG